jgi:murein DD-endopeptidase MepM/ murein hydrolase activator NlpD
MKTIIKSGILIFAGIISHPSFAQAFFKDKTDEMASYPFRENGSQSPCITAEEYVSLNNQIAANAQRLGLNPQIHRNALTTSLIWPIRAAANLSDCGYHFIGAYVDENTAVGSITDFNCEGNTYDGHHGTDIAIWPYGFYKMDNSQVEVIAAAAGVIIQKADGNFDRNCSANNLTANSIIIQHTDGSYALYWHMKKNSVTTKAVGQSVAAGEYLGAVGSSGSASGPHLHFEVWAGSTNDTYKDPFSGPCNTLNANSWWTSQKPHTDSKVIKVSVNTTDIVLPGCPTTETPNESDSYTIPFQGVGLPAGYAKFYIFMRDDIAGLTGDCKILNPNGTTFSSWNYTTTANNKIYIRGFSKLLPTITGTYTFQVIYNGVACAKNFNIVNPLSLPDHTGLNALQIAPNPAADSFNIIGNTVENGNYTFTLNNLSGQIIYFEKTAVEGNSIQKTFTTSSLASGIYLLSIDNGNSKTTRKIIKK